MKTADCDNAGVCRPTKGEMKIMDVTFEIECKHCKTNVKVKNSEVKGVHTFDDGRTYMYFRCQKCLRICHCYIEKDKCSVNSTYGRDHCKSSPKACGA